MNAKVADILNQFAELYDVAGDTYRASAYLRAAKSVRRLPWELSRELGPIKIEGVGKTIRAVIEEYLRAGAVRELQRLQKRRDIVTIRKLSVIPGVGPVTARKWYEQGIRSLSDLRRAVRRGSIRLTHMQGLGLKYYKDLNERIPRAEVAAIGKKICGVVRGVDRDATCEVAGSYRRGLPDSGDIDILITTPVYKSGFLAEVLARLRRTRNYVDSYVIGEQRVSFLYAEKKVRQVDLLYLHRDAYAPALVYFTGSGSFNERMRGLFKARGYLLNQNGLYKLEKAGRRLIPMQSEEDVFRELGMDYIPPELRE